MTDDDDIQEYVRPWRGLTEDEVFALSNTMPYADRFEFAKAVEAKLKEKNTWGRWVKQLHEQPSAWCAQ